VRWAQEHGRHIPESIKVMEDRVDVFRVIMEFVLGE
jgi:hypothetical protein